MYSTGGIYFTDNVFAHIGKNYISVCIKCNAQGVVYLSAKGRAAITTIPIGKHVATTGKQVYITRGIDNSYLTALRIGNVKVACSIEHQTARKSKGCINCRATIAGICGSACTRNGSYNLCPCLCKRTQ